VRQLRHEAQIVQPQVETAVRLCQEHGFPLYLALSRAMYGWALAMQGEVRAGIQELQAGIAARRATGTTLLLPSLLLLLAEAYFQAGQTHEALDQVDEALRLVEASGEHLEETQLRRLKGELLLAMGEDATKTEACFQRALDVARRQRARSWELRAATSLARLWQRQRRTEEARALLQGVYGWFTEGLDTLDLQEARALLDALA